MIAGIRTHLTYENRAVLILCIVGGIAAFDMLAFNFLAPMIANDLNLTNSQVGLIGGAGLLTWSLGAMTTATISDRIGRRRIFLVGALVCLALFSTATAFATSFATLITARLLVGLSEGPVVPIQTALIHAESSPHRRGLNMGIVQNLGSLLLGGIMGPLILVGMATQFGWRNAFLIAAIPALAIAVIVRFYIREPVPLPIAERNVPLGQTLRTIVAVRNIRLCFLIGTCAIGWLATTSVFIPLWLIRTVHYAPQEMSIVMAWVGVGGAVSSIVIPMLSDRLGRRPVLIATALIGIITPLGMMLNGASLPLLCATVFVGSFFTGIMPMFIGIIPMESVEARNGATALSLVMGCAQIAGSLCGPLLSGILADQFSLTAPFWISTALALGAAFFGLFLIETAPSKLTKPAVLAAS